MHCLVSNRGKGQLQKDRTNIQFTENFLWSAAVGLSKSEVVSKGS